MKDITVVYRRRLRLKFSNVHRQSLPSEDQQASSASALRGRRVGLTPRSPDSLANGLLLLLWLLIKSELRSLPYPRGKTG
jgi:hypothetical protein